MRHSGVLTTGSQCTAAHISIHCPSALPRLPIAQGVQRCGCRATSRVVCTAQNALWLPGRRPCLRPSQQLQHGGNGSAADELGSLLDIEKWPAWLLQAALQYFAASIDIEPRRDKEQELRQARSRMPASTDTEPSRKRGPESRQARPRTPVGQQDDKFDFGKFVKGELPGKLAALLALIVFSRVGVYMRVPGVDAERFAEAVQSQGILGYIDTLSGGSISRVGIFSLGIVPYINASIILQLLATAFPSLKKLQREEGPQGRARFQLYQKLLALAAAVIQAVGQLTYIRPFVPEWDATWLAVNSLTLVAGAMVLVHVADMITELKIGNGTSVLITANIASALPASVGAAVQQAADKDASALPIYGLAFFLTTLGVVYVQEAERKIPMNYANRYRNSALAQQSYLPFKVNATGVMPVIFSTTLLSLPTGLAKYATWLEPVAVALGPTGLLYLPVNVSLIVLFNYYYTFLQLDPKDMADQLKRAGGAIPAVRPGRATADYITKTLNRMSILGSAFLGALAAAPPLVEAVTGLQAFRGFAGTSILILVGVATDTARRVKAEQAMQRYKDYDRLYDEM